jgi:ATP-binding cassette subfamily B protein
VQSIIQTLASEKVARDLRSRLSDKISRQSYAFILQANPSRLLTNLTSDIDSIKLFVSHAVASIVSSVFVIIGASILLIFINWQLALVVLSIIPIISIAFFLIFNKVKFLFKRSKEIVDWLNKVINESILGAALIRVLNAQQTEYNKFLNASTAAKDVGISIIKLFATLVPIISFTANLATLGILALGGHYIINEKLTLGDFAAFNSYLFILIFPIIIIGFMSNLIAQSSASYQRIFEVLEAQDPEEKGTLTSTLSGDFEVNHVQVSYNGKPVLKNISFAVRGITNTAIIGPTAAGKSQLLFLLTALTKPDSGTITFDDNEIGEYQKKAFHKQIGFVFQDSIIFNMSLRENIAFSENVPEAQLQKAIETAELQDFVNSLPEKLDTMISERGSNLSGGQKQRIMLARALAMNPRILLLDDFTSRVDRRTEQKIMKNVQVNYPAVTIITVTQKIAPVEHFDQIILLMESEIIASGKHEHLLHTSPEYVQIYNSQRSTSHYDVQS